MLTLLQMKKNITQTTFLLILTNNKVFQNENFEDYCGYKILLPLFYKFLKRIY